MPLPSSVIERIDTVAWAAIVGLLVFGLGVSLGAWVWSWP